MSSKFCTSCGATLNPSARFCGGCGLAMASNPPPPPAQPQYAPPPAPPSYQQPPGYPMPPYHQPPYAQQAYAPPPPPQPPPVYGYPQAAPQYAMPPAGEALIGIIPGVTRKKGLFGVEALNAVVTNSRIIFAVQTNEMVREETARAGQGQGFFGKMAGAMAAGYNIWKRYLNIPPEQALRENPGNFAIYLNQIRRVKFDAGRTLFQKGPVSIGVGVNRDNDEPAHLEIETVAERLKFDVATHFQEQARNALRQAGLIR
jgi:hypothetical protein